MTAPKKRAAHGGPRPGAGRPPVGEEPRLATIQIRCSRTEAQRWSRNAAAVGISIAVVARAALDSWCDGVEGREPFDE